MMEDNETKWVGRIIATGAIIVYDPSMQIENHKNIYVYSVARRLMRQFDPIEIRKKVTTLPAEERLEILLQYQEWKEHQGSAFMKSEPVRIIEETARIEAANVRKEKEQEAKIAEIIRRREEFLENQGIPITKARKVIIPSKLRVTHCWNCKKSLNNFINLECESCNWIVCECGACGCGRLK